ncbi:MAG: efflux RND transporter periplasmic adaptor subunit [Desulfomicrobium sp.]|uniref:Efflux RND transporter periplasmic adaptor subunit n=2 Tax=Alphaproteobacteria TaxID=28211 RepID=A0A926SA04_9HYPH|nr:MULTISPECIES: efflux RND transporter periplasmic adaptor subunit [Hyphomicrobiales]KFE35053.1 RND family efflux transporter MFP subunit [Thioclava atlantica]MBU4530808.1 efflux RND transporter periplasmic adaptor subunit [Alphaproteobacteria bacterium]MBV1712564.1 efflux RND transporter periplasmic adaptor subunit [Desulfomicrobium sp.]MBD1547974.1 efflux RND transporter periplasmic adaptor subunit [Roseibium aggregatum]MBU4542938.1 efflux RND transporter periplasmic adaptor subunit [Alphap
MRRISLLGVVLAAAVGVGFLFFTERPLTVTVVQPVHDVTLRIYGLGTVEARILSRVGFEVGAALTRLSADAGDSVTKGQELAVLHSTEQEARVARARAAVAANEANLAKAGAAVVRARAVLAEREAANRRQQGLVQRDVASAQRAEETQRDEDVARADLAVAEADVAVIQAQGADAAAALRQEEALLAHHRLVAPFDAQVVTRHAEAGTVVKAGDPIFTLIDPATIWIQAYVDEERAGQLAIGQPGTIRLRSQPSAEFHGSIARIGIESDRVNEERRVWLTCSDCPAEMFLGEQAEVRITTGNRDSALMVPEVAITGFDGHRGMVWTVQDGRLARVGLTFGARDDRGRVEVTGGLPEGATIVAGPPKGAAEGRRARTSEAP